MVAAVYDYHDNMVGCIGIAATVFSFELEDVDHLAGMVKETAKKISNGMGNQ